MTKSGMLAIPNFYSGTATSMGVSAEAAFSLPSFKNDESITRGHEKIRLFQSIVNARAAAQIDNWDGDGAPAVTKQTVEAAISLAFALPETLPEPAITPETTGEIAFEWFRDKDHVAVITVQDGL